MDTLTHWRISERPISSRCPPSRNRPSRDHSRASRFEQRADGLPRRTQRHRPHRAAATREYARQSRGFNLTAPSLATLTQNTGMKNSDDPVQRVRLSRLGRRARAVSGCCWDEICQVLSARARPSLGSCEPDYRWQHPGCIGAPARRQGRDPHPHFVAPCDPYGDLDTPVTSRSVGSNSGSGMCR